MFWHDGDPDKQVGLITNIDPCQPERFRPLGLIGILRAAGRRRTASRPRSNTSYASLRREATHQLRPGRDTLVPVLRALAYDLRLQLRDLIRPVFTDHREYSKVLQVLLDTPGRYIHGAGAD